MSRQPLVSIVITSYNRGKFIDKAIQSCLSQDYPNIEIVISDNHSTDDTDEIVKKYILDSRIKYFVNEVNIGMIPNFKLATEKRTHGEYLTYLSSDDYFCNDKFISAAVNLINKHSNIVLVAAKNATFYNELDTVIKDKTDHIFKDEFMKGVDLFELFPTCFSPGWGAVLMDRKKLLNTKIFDSKAQSLDYEANLKIMLQGDVAFIKECSYVWRRHGSQASGNMDPQTQINNFDFIENVYSFAKQLHPNMNSDGWRKKVYYAYLNGVVRRLINNKDDMNKILKYAKEEKKIAVTFLNGPKYFILFAIYKNYNTLRPFLRIFWTKLYQSIEKDK